MVPNCFIFALILYIAKGCITQRRTFDVKIDVFETINSAAKEIGSYRAVIDPVPAGNFWDLGNTRVLFNELCLRLPPNKRGFYGHVSNFSAAPRNDKDSTQISLKRFVK